MGCFRPIYASTRRESEGSPPCVPVITAPWSPGASVANIDDQKALTDDSKCMGAWTGSIEVIDPGSGIDVE